MKPIKKHDQILALTLKIDDSSSLLMEEETWLNVVTTTYGEVLKRFRQYIGSLTATDRASQISSKTAKKTVSNRSGNSAASKTSSQIQKNCFLQNIAEKNSRGSRKVRYDLLYKNNRSKLKVSARKAVD